MKILTFSSLFPNAQMPSHGIFVRTRLQRLLAYSSEIESRVIAPVPWYPRSIPFPREYARMATVDGFEQQGNLQVWHPRYLVIPKIGMNFSPATLARAAIACARQLLDDCYAFELVDAHYFYPDGVAAAILAQHFDVPFTITARGTDINLIPRYPRPRRKILAAAEQAGRIFTVCAALRDELVDMGVATEKIVVARNGVDLELFHPPENRTQLRQRLGFAGTSLCTVGHLIDRKGHDLCIRALATLPDVTLYVIGDGPRRRSLGNIARQLGVADRVVFAGRVDQPTLRDYYGACDALVLASDREGWANVLLESMACGTPVVATAIWGTPEVVATAAAGQLVEQRNPEAIAAAVRRLLADLPQRDATRAYAEQFSWDDTSALQLDVFRELINGQ